MKIVEMRVTPVAMADPPLFSSYGLHAPYALRTVVELVSEDGITGAGETHGGASTLTQFEHVRDLVIGRDAYDLARLQAAVEERYQIEGSERQSQTFVLPGENSSDIALRVFSALEVAALDLIGKATHVPVCDLLGGRVRDEVPFSAYLFYKRAGGGGVGEDAREDKWGPALDTDGIVQQAKAFVAEYGFGSIKLKGGVFPPEQEIEAMRALYDELGSEYPLRIDPNGAWTVRTSIEVGAALAGILEYFEDPTPGLEGLAAVRGALLDRSIDTLIASNNAMTSFNDLPQAIEHGSVQVILSDHHYWGGLRAVTQLGRVAEINGIGLSMHSNSHLGLSLLAMVHLAAATPHLTYASDTHYPWQQAEDEILEGGRVAIRDGVIQVPDGFGHGGTIDQDSLARGRERFLKCVFTKRDDTAEMRKHVDPEWTRLAPRW